MVTVINAKRADGVSFGLRLSGGRVEAVLPPVGEPQVRGLAGALPSTVPLLSVGDFAALPVGTIVDAGGLMVLPAGIDMHVHSRDPGLTHKEDWQTLARGAWRGGVIGVADMPNTVPATMSRESVLLKAERARASGLEFGLFLGVGLANITQVAALLNDAQLPLCGLKVFYGRTTGELLYDDLETLARSLPDRGDKIIVFHSEDQCTVDCNHDRLKSRLHEHGNTAFEVHSEIRSSEAAHRSTRTILEWARTVYKRPIHIAHVSTPLEVELVAEAKARGVAVTCEVAPHHLLFSTEDYVRLGPLVKMNPPLRSPAEVEELNRLFGLGAIDVFATDHAPHLLSEKYTEVALSPSGVPGVELFYQLLVALARRTALPLAKAVHMASTAPAALLGWRHKGQLAPGYDADFVVLGTGERVVQQHDVVAKCGWTPYAGWRVPSDVLSTWNLGRQVFCRTDAARGNA